MVAVRTAGCYNRSGAIDPAPSICGRIYQSLAGSPAQNAPFNLRSKISNKVPHRLARGYRLATPGKSLKSAYRWQHSSMAFMMLFYNFYCTVIWTFHCGIRDVGQGPRPELRVESLFFVLAVQFLTVRKRPKYAPALCHAYFRWVPSPLKNCSQPVYSPRRVHPRWLSLKNFSNRHTGGNTVVHRHCLGFCLITMIGRAKNYFASFSRTR